MPRYSFTQPRCPDRISVVDIETSAPPQPEDAFPPWPLHSPIVAGVLNATRERYCEWRFEMEVVNFVVDPTAAIERLSHLIEGRALVTFNGRGFDLPVLALTAMKQQRFDLVGLTNAWQAHRFHGHHYDLADMMSGYGAARGCSLEKLCSALGVPVKLDCDGSDVAELMAKRDFEAIDRYVSQDCAGTLCGFAAVEALRSNDPGYAGSLISQFGRWIADQGLEHLRPFERIRGHEEYERLSLLAMAEAAIAALDHRQHMKFVTNVPGPSGAFVQQASDL